MSTRLLGLAVLTFTLGLAPIAEAQPQSEKAKAAWRLEEGKRALAKGDLDKAITALEEAHTILRQPTSGVPLAQALVKQGRLADALAVARAVQASPKAGKEAFSVTRARADADALVADLDKRVPKLRVTAPEGAAVTIDGRDVPVDDGVRRVDPGDHSVEGKLGDKKASAAVKLVDGDDKTVTLDFGGKTAAAAAPAAAPESDGGAQPPAGGPAKPPAQEEPAGGGNPAAATAAIVGFTTFAAGAGLGVGAFLWGTSRLDDLDGPCGGSCSGRLAREERDAEAMRLFGFVGFGLAGAGLVTGIVGAAVAGSASSSESAIAPEIGPAYAGLRVRID
jgi:hypothetical protein